jgi:drug/metabolite transporter (DMT)-like permease
MYIAECSALAAALCWSFGGLLATGPTRTLGAMTFNRLRILIVFMMMAVSVLITGGWRTLAGHSCLVLMVSAIVGIYIGDTAFYEALKRIGPRRTGILFATNAPITAVMGYFSLRERLPANTTLGCVLIMIGVLLAVFFGMSAAQKHAFEKIQGSLGTGVALGFFAACCQAVSVIIVRPVMAVGIDPLAASTLRVGTAALALTLTQFLQMGRPAAAVTMGPRLLGQVALSGTVGMALGMTFLLMALAHGQAGLVSTLSATSPILILPVLWIATRERPAPGAWVGAFLAVAGAAFIFSPWKA